MDYSKIIAELDAEIERLQKARTALASLGQSSGTSVRGTSGPRRSGLRKMSAAARARIAAAQRARWARFKAKRKAS